MKVYLLWRIEYGQSSLVGAYATIELAEHARWNKNGKLFIEELEVTDEYE